jgi:uncharacterized repeat protein (TIGR03803 family)
LFISGPCQKLASDVAHTQVSRRGDNEVPVPEFAPPSRRAHRQARVAYWLRRFDAATRDGPGQQNRLGPQNDSRWALTTIYGFLLRDLVLRWLEPGAGLTEGGDGHLYGTTIYGGNHLNKDGYGGIFKITPNGTLTNLYNFCALSGCVLWP